MHAWAASHMVDRCTAIRAFIMDGLDRDGLIFARAGYLSKIVGLSRAQVADLGTSLAYAVLVATGNSHDQMEKSFERRPGCAFEETNDRLRIGYAGASKNSAEYVLLRVLRFLVGSVGFYFWGVSVFCH